MIHSQRQEQHGASCGDRNRGGEWKWWWWWWWRVINPELAPPHAPLTQESPGGEPTPPCPLRIRLRVERGSLVSLPWQLRERETLDPKQGEAATGWKKTKNKKKEQEEEGCSSSSSSRRGKLIRAAERAPLTNGATPPSPLPFLLSSPPPPPPSSSDYQV